MKDYIHQITNVIVFKNGMIAVFDQYDKQMPTFQGRKEDVMKKIKDRIMRQTNRKVGWTGLL